MLGDARWRLVFALRLELCTIDVERVDGNISDCCTLPSASRPIKDCVPLGTRQSECSANPFPEYLKH